MANTVPVSTTLNYVNLDFDLVDGGEAQEKADYQKRVRYGYPPSLMGDIVTTWPGDMVNRTVHTLPYALSTETHDKVAELIAHDMDRAAVDEVHSWRTPEYASSRYVLVPICSITDAGGASTLVQPLNLATPVPTNTPAATEGLQRPSPAPEGFQKGMSYATWWQGNYSKPESDRALAILPEATGAQWIATHLPPLKTQM